MMKTQIFDNGVKNKECAVSIKISGLVQGVGFRPFIYRLAKIYDLKGWVDNRNDGVDIKLEGTIRAIQNFLSTVRIASPPASNIDQVDWEIVEREGFANFRILKSKENDTSRITEISPDIAVCEDCLLDMKSQSNRINYPFINCTNCGPRFSIVKALPYDRKSTSMRKFPMCPQCSDEYENVDDRRFHAQPIACAKCGPHYILIEKKKQIDDFSFILKKIAHYLNAGKILAIKGMGGFHLMCDAHQEDVVIRLRKAKTREAKPFALMFKNSSVVKEYAELNSTEEELILSLQRPIVLLKQKKALPFSINNGLGTLGCILPYLPLHYLMFEHLKTDIVVLTSGNNANEPIAIDNIRAQNNLGAIYDAILINNRDIVNRSDDSVCFVANNQSRMIRRSRAYAPASFKLPFHLEGILASGAELTNCFAIGKDHQVILSQHIGDLKNLETYTYFKDTVKRFEELFRFKPNLVVHDLHPDYLSTKFARETGLESIAVQHHHAHIAACLAENELDEKVIGIAFDGTGYGSDGTIWGGEFLIADLNNFERYTHFEAIPLPGGDKVTDQPWRSALAYLYSYFKDEIWNLDFVKELDKKEVEILLRVIDQNINSPLCSSAGRLFDAVSALLGVCKTSSFQAEAPMRLEALLELNIKEYYPFDYKDIISFKPMFVELLCDIENKQKIGVISAKFHNTIVQAILLVSEKIRSEKGIKKVALSGGSFQNKYIVEKAETRLRENGFEVYSQHKYPSNDGGIALGQMAIAAKRRSISVNSIK